ncbi:hypothetical protein BTO06_10625 [Tenacibaculum sp. SZ-18]|uniref:hypothetical protein n=1 Tax=Tenacibaculum sp. SZ-18 TaxID=754423 RepID=UPI000C2CF55A|nr:hypothetical protein [Tenacibaculum sp. SZ-18]AUC15568.1 hypothetical protein BTO06_10625 [Tenacibaculum sp. SZ-18]
MKIKIIICLLICLAYFYYTWNLQTQIKEYQKIIESQEPISYTIIETRKTSRPSGKSMNKGHSLTINYKNEKYTIDISSNQYRKLSTGNQIPLYHFSSKNKIISLFDIQGRNRASGFMFSISIIVLIYGAYLIMKLLK